MTKKKKIEYRLATDKKMFLLLQHAIDTGIVETEQAFFDAIGFARSNKTNILNGTQSFSIKHIHAAAVLTDANVNWIFDLENNIERAKVKDPVKRIKAALFEIEQQLKK